MFCVDSSLWSVIMKNAFNIFCFPLGLFISLSWNTLGPFYLYRFYLLHFLPNGASLLLL